ncbi:putative Peptidyl-prolyl cis-trans isomerase FPR2 [Blattamonas nauphoetae]|uniref:peptidylprolyl isomerase n=1 Tax=Blattamonas nauphoetae TaxID=2049346 RepID=A0ABQ9X3L2_9EUKA|nr:putative Peptidyl-prolyl cis-trans isomerase FPR2 [Blattamonas nauphoetae]
MIHTLWLVSFLFSVTFSEDTEKSESSEELKVEITTLFKPETCEKKAKRGNKLKVHYVGTVVETGEEFDNSHERKVPFKFRLGEGAVIKGWEQGLIGMCEGEKRKLVIPSELAYGKYGIPDQIPPNAELMYIIDLVEVSDKEKKGPTPLERVEEKNRAERRRKMKKSMLGELKPDGSRFIEHVVIDGNSGPIEV